MDERTDHLWESKAAITDLGSFLPSNEIKLLIETTRRPGGAPEMGAEGGRREGKRGSKTVLGDRGPSQRHGLVTLVPV